MYDKIESQYRGGRKKGSRNKLPSLREALAANPERLQEFLDILYLAAASADNAWPMRLKACEIALKLYHRCDQGGPEAEERGKIQLERLESIFGLSRSNLPDPDEPE